MKSGKPVRHIVGDNPDPSHRDGSFYFDVENRRVLLRTTLLPGSGLTIWHSTLEARVSKWRLAFSIQKNLDFCHKLKQNNQFYT